MKYVNNNQTGKSCRTASVAADVVYEISSVSADTAAVVGQYLDVDATSGVKTITPPTGVAGAEFFVRKSDATTNKVTVTGLGDLAFQGTAIHFVYTTAWRAS